MILLDLKNNELVFSGMQNKQEFLNALGSVKGIKLRECDSGKVYVCLRYINHLQEALKDYAGKFTLTGNYKRLQTLLSGNEVTIDWYPHKCFVSGGRIPFDLIIPQMSYFDKKFLHMQFYKRKKHSGLIHLFNVEEASFPSGLLERFIQSLNERGVTYIVNRHFDFPKPYLNLTAVFPFTPSSDQIAAADALDKANNGIGKLPTGFGKTSFLSVELIARKGVRSLFLANQRVLIDDARNDFSAAFKDCVEEIGIIGDGHYNPQDITVGSIQGVIAAMHPPTHNELVKAKKEMEYVEKEVQINPTKEAKDKLRRRKKKYETMLGRIDKSKDIRAYLKTVDMFIIDEGQSIGTKQWDEFLEHCPAAYRYTITATDTRTDGGRIQLVAATGERRYESTASEQIAKDRLSEFKGYFKRFDHGIPKEVSKKLTLNYHTAYDAFIVNNYERNKYLVSWLLKWRTEGHSILGLVTRKAHAENVIAILHESGLSEGVDFCYVDGDTPKRVRQDIIARFRNSEFPILLGTSIFDVGFNAKNASKMVRFNGGSSEVREPQRAGRTVRKRENNEIGETIDIIDINVPFFQSQGYERYKILANEFGAKRVTLLPGVIEQHNPIAKLEESVENLDHSPDKVQMKEAIHHFLRGEEAAEEAVAKIEENQLTLESLINDDALNSLGEMYKQKIKNLLK